MHNYKPNTMVLRYQPNGADVLKFFEIKSKYMKARYHWRFSYCSYLKIVEHVKVSEKTAMRWVLAFNKEKKHKNGVLK